MEGSSFVFTSFLIFSGAAVLATFALFARQALIVAYIFLGVLLGPWVAGLLDNPHLIGQFAHVGIMFLLFLLGLNLHPQRLIEMLREATLVTLASSLAFALLGAGVSAAFGFGLADSLVIGAAVMFSSTILGLKLLPTTVLHHRHTGGVIISILLLQDIVAIAVLLILQGVGPNDITVWRVVTLIAALPGLILFAVVLQRYVLLRLFARFDQIQEYVFLVSIGWCLGMAEFAGFLGLSHEIGSFIAGVSIATSPISRYIAESLKPLRDFFLVMFFVSLGAGFNMNALDTVLFPGLVLGLAILVIKPAVFALLFRGVGERGGIAWEIGVRLGQASEFALLIGYLALEASIITQRAAFLIQVTTVLSFIGSSYWIVLKYPTPIAVSDKLRRD